MVLGQGLMENLANVRSGLVRMSSYMGMVNFLILVGITLRWLHAGVGSGVPFVLWMIGGFALAASGLTLGAWIDRRWIWPREVGINQGVNQITLVWALQAAELVHRLDGEVNGLGDRVEAAMKRSGRLEEYLAAKRALEVRDV